MAHPPYASTSQFEHLLEIASLNCDIDNSHYAAVPFSYRIVYSNKFDILHQHCSMPFHEALSLTEPVLQSDTQDNSDFAVYYTFVLMIVTWICQYYYY